MRSRSFAAALLTVLAAAAAPVATHAQTATDEEQAVRAVVQRLFDGMRARDTVMMRSTMSDQMMMFGVNRNGTAINASGPEPWLSSIARIPEGTVADEVLHDVEIRVDGPLATVWTYYDLFVDERFSHCGYDAFIMLKTQDEWKIAAVADSRRTENCRQQKS